MNSLTLSFTKQELIEIIGITKCRELFPEQFKVEKMHDIVPFTVETDDESALISIADNTAFNEKHCSKVFLLNDEYVWRVVKRYDTEGTYRTYLTPVLRSEYKQRRRRKTTKE